MIYMGKIAFNELISTLKAVNHEQTDERFFEGLLTVEMKDKQGEITIVDELYKVLPIWMDRGAPITDTHSNRIIGKGINYAKTVVKNEDGVELPAIKITGKIYKNYELDNLIWEKIKRNEYKGLSFGGATRSQRTPMRMKDGSMAYALTDLEHYEVAVCKDPAVPMAIITDFNPIAKAQFNSEKRDDGKLLIRCTGMGCYVEKSLDFVEKPVMSPQMADAAQQYQHQQQTGHVGAKNEKGKIPKFDPKTGKKIVAAHSKRNSEVINTNPKPSTGTQKPNTPPPNKFAKRNVGIQAGDQSASRTTTGKKEKLVSGNKPLASGHAYRRQQNPTPSATPAGSVQTPAALPVGSGTSQGSGVSVKPAKVRAPLMSYNASMGLRGHSLKANLSEEDSFEGKVQKLIAEGKSRESAEKIVGSFVKGETSKAKKLWVPKRHGGDKPVWDEYEAEESEKKPTTVDSMKADGDDSKEEGKDDQYLSEINERTKEGNNASVTTDDGFNARYSEKDKEEGDDSKERHDNGKDHSDSSGDHHSMYNQDGANPQRLNTVNRSITEINQAVTTLNQYVIDEVSKADTTVNQQGGVRNDISGINRQGSLDPTDASGQITPVKNDDKEEKDEEKYSSEKETEGTKEHETNKSISKLSKLLNI